MNWQLQEAKNRLSALVEAAMTGQPQTITRHGRPAVIVLDVGTYQRMTADRSSFVDHLLAQPVSKLDEDELFQRPRAALREVDL